MSNDKMALVPLEHEMLVYDNMAKQAVQSKFYRNFGDVSAVMTIMLSARELGISPMSALNGGLNIIQGKVEVSARMMNAMIRRGGHSIKTLECIDTMCKMQGKRADNGDEEVVEFSFEEAERAGLVKPGGGWHKYPSDMLYARCLSRLARRLYPDIIGCSYVEGEISGEVKVEPIKPVADTYVKDAMVKEIVGLFSGEDKIHIAEYVKQVHEKYEIPYEEIVRKYHIDPKGFEEKFNKWKESHSVKSH